MTREPNDPTRAGSPVPTDGTVLLSRNEVEVLCSKAARGSGMTWGHAEEAGGAVGWLHAQGIDGAAALLGVLETMAGRQVMPVVAPGHWVSDGGGPLCPVATGAALCDFRDLPEGQLGCAGLSLGTVSHPVILLPFLSEIAQHLGTGVEMNWDGGSVRVHPQGQCVGDVARLAGQPVATVTLTLVGTDTHPSFAGGAKPCDGIALARLNDLALRTTVPPSERSRADAGAGTSDND